jgi:hypothetical protein
MTDHSAILQFVKDPATDCNSGFMYANAECTSTATARLVKPRPTPGLNETTFRSFSTADVCACDDNILAAAMVADIRRCTTGEKPISTLKHAGYIWVARSLDYWLKHFGLKSVSKVRTALKDLKASGLVICEEHWFNGNLTAHYRIGGYVKFNIPLPKKEAPDVEFNIPPVEINTPITQGYTGVEKILKEKILSPCEQEPFAPPKPQANPEKHSGGVETPWNEKDEFEAVWKATLKKHKKPCPEKLSEKERSQLDRIWHQIRTELHTPVADVLEVIVSRWLRFTDLFGDMFVGAPKPGLLLKHLGNFALMFRIGPDDEDLLPEEFLIARAWWLEYLASTLDLKTRFAKDLARTDYLPMPKPATVPAPVELEALAVVTSSATANLETASAVVPATLPAKKPAPQKSKPLPTLDELKKHKLEREAAAKVAAEAERKRLADAAFSGSWLT